MDRVIVGYNSTNRGDKCQHQFFDVYTYCIKKLIMIQKLELRTAGLKPAKIGHVDWENEIKLTSKVTISVFTSVFVYGLT